MWQTKVDLLYIVFKFFLLYLTFSNLSICTPTTEKNISLSESPVCRKLSKEGGGAAPRV